MMRAMIILGALSLSCKSATAPDPVRIDPYALFYVRNDKATSPIYYAFLRFPNRSPIENSRLGSVGAGEELCTSFGLESIIPGAPENMVQLVLMVYEDDRDPAGTDPRPAIDSLKSPTVDPFALGANTRETPHRFRLWLKADGSTFFDFGRYDETAKWEQEPGWPCPTMF